jgi:hypothetical protein
VGGAPVWAGAAPAMVREATLAAINSFDGIDLSPEAASPGPSPRLLKIQPPSMEPGSAFS